MTLDDLRKLKETDSGYITFEQVQALLACAEALKMFVRAEEAFENDTGIQCDDALTDSYKAAREALRRLEQLT